MTRWMLAFITGLLVIGCVWFVTAKPSLLRVDGLYYSYDEAEEVFYYLRFYEDGAVLAVSSFEAPEEANTWFYRHHPTARFGQGEYRAETDQRLQFFTVTSYGQIDYEAVLLDGAMQVKLFSHRNGYRGVSRYRFVPFPAPP